MSGQVVREISLFVESWWTEERKLFGSNGTTINLSVASWEFARGVEVDSPLSGWGDKSINPKSALPACARLLFLRRAKILSPFPRFPPLDCQMDAILDLQRRVILSTPLGSAESIAFDQRLRDLNLVGNVQNVIVPRLKYLPKKFQISYLTSFLSGKTVLF